jgi:hypothetical protein
VEAADDGTQQTLRVKNYSDVISCYNAWEFLAVFMHLGEILK